LFWQDELWRRFAATYPGEVPVTFPEIAEALRLCPVHGCSLKVAGVPVLYGYVVMEEEYRNARAERFPFANMAVLGGCCVGDEKVVSAYYCEACREELEKWGTSKKADPSAPPAARPT
jgi:hypothetical protein